MTPQEEIIRAALYIFGIGGAFIGMWIVYYIIWWINELKERKQEKNLPSYMRAYDYNGNRIRYDKNGRRMK